MRQTPDSSGKWGDLQFTEETIDACDYLIVLNWGNTHTRVFCPPEHVWAIIQEPPTGEYFKKHFGTRSYARVYTTDPNRKGNRYLQSQPALPWHVNKTYDELIAMKVPEKNKGISTITSNRTRRPGHRLRVQFLKKIIDRLDFSLYGKGYSYIDDKWYGLSPYRYSIAIENYRTSYYWTEKIADCFLSWTMPIYYGCTEITKFFPSEALIEIDINQPDEALKIIENSVEDNLWEKNFDAICEARRLVLNEYQFFPFLYNQIQEHRFLCSEHNKKKLTITHNSKFPLWYRVLRKIWY